MTLLDFFDHRTLLACEGLLASVFCVVFVAMHRAYPQVRGIRLIALSFLLLIPSAVLLDLGGHTASFFSTVLANYLGFVALIARYEAVVKFTRGRSFRWLLWGATLAGTGVVYFFSEVRSELAPRIIATSLVAMVISLFTAWPLLRGARYSSQHSVMRVFGLVQALLAAECLNRAVMTYRWGAPGDLFTRNSIQTPAFAVGIIGTAAAGVCFLVLSSNELVIRTRKEAHQDPVSGTFNRRGLEVMLTMEMNHANRSGETLSVALIDLDHFKAINDERGHSAGDMALRQIALAMSNELRRSDHIGRFGGDEFLLIFPGTLAAEAMHVADRIAVHVAEIALPGLETVTLSAGITEAVEGEAIDELIGRADRAMYRAKSGGRNCRRVLLAGDAEDRQMAVVA